MLQPLEDKEFDAIVVGTGPGGATVARHLSKQKKNVLILERGAKLPPRAGFLRIASILGSDQVSDNLSTTRAFAIGGTTAVYFAVAEVPPLDSFLDLGIDLSKELEDAGKELPLAPLSDELLGVQALRVRNSALELGYRWQKKLMLIDQSKCTSGYSRGAKWYPERFVEEALGDGAQLVSRATVLKVLVERNEAIGVEYKLRKGRNRFEICRAYGSKIVLAAGALASPIILRHSGIKVNHGFYCDPSFVVVGTVPRLKGRNSFTGSMGTDIEGGIGYGDANFPRALYQMFMLGNRKFMRLLSHSTSIGVGVIVTDGLGGELREDGRYYKQLTDEVSAKLKKGEEVAKNIIRNAGGKNIFRSQWMSARVGGLLRFQEELDNRLKTEYDNLYVCDASVIPENMRIPPTLTLICLGKYLANHLSLSI